MRLVAACLALGLFGCSGLILRPDDTGAQTAGKVAARVILWPVTMGLSEMHLEYVDTVERCDAGRCPLSPEAAALLIQNGGLRPIPPPYQIPTTPVGQTYRPAVTCTTTRIGDQATTTCY